MDGVATLSFDPSAESQLRQRWSRSLRQVTRFSLVLPASIVLSCHAIAVVAVLIGAPWPVVVSPVVSALPAVVLRRWFRQQTPLDPGSWLSAAFLTAAAQLVVGAIPTYGIAISSATGASRGVVTLLFALCWVLATAMCLSAHRANRTLLEPLIPELGSTDVRLSLAARVQPGDGLESAHVVVERDRVEWSVRLHRQRGNGSRRAGISVPFGQLRQVTPATLPIEPAARPWLTLADGTVLEAGPGPAILLDTLDGAWLIPVHDAGLVAEVVNRRRELWALGHR